MSLPIDHARLPRPGDIFAQKYRLECILGSGGMGVVFGAIHLLTHKRVAIKWLAVDGASASDTLSDTTQRFMREARLAGEFQHPNVVQVYDVGESQGSFFMVMEWLEGESLAARLERVERLSFQEAFACLVPCMQAIQRAHDVGIVHRDIKPANIFLCDATADRPAVSKVLDFGISKRVHSSIDVGSFVTRTGMLIGTPQYLAPEQLRARPVDPRTDIYGFGVVLYETLAGVLPFTADNFGDLVVEISTGTPRSLRELVPDLPLGVEQLVAKAMARNPDERYASLHELIADLEALDPSPLSAATQPQLRLPTSVTPITLERTGTRRRAEPRRTRWVALLAVAALSAGVTGLFLRPSERPSHVAIKRVVRAAASPPAAAEPPFEPTGRDSAGLPPGHDALPSSLPVDPMPQLDASIDSGRPIPLQNAHAAGAAGGAAPTTPAEVEGRAAPTVRAETESRDSANRAEPTGRADAEKPARVAGRLGVASQQQTEVQPAPTTGVAKSAVLRASTTPAPAPPVQVQPVDPQPAAAAASRDPGEPNAASVEPSLSESNAREHNPLHMDIQ